jgi:pyruvate kinase
MGTGSERPSAPGGPQAPGAYRRTKIVVTLGPACDDEATLGALLDAGMDVARLALAHGSLAEHEARLARLRHEARLRGRTVAIMADLPGPKLRAAPFGVDATLAVGATVVIDPTQGVSTATVLGVEDPDALGELEAGDRVSVGDGAVVLEVTDAGPPARATVTHGGQVRGRPGLRLPAQRVRRSTPTDADVALLEWSLRVGVDLVAVSFVRRGADLDVVRRRIGPAGPLVMAKVETADAVDRLEEIMEAADAVMVARGDLGGEIPIEELPHVQKRIVRACVTRGLPVITATQMLESMTVTPTPTRAEATDVANAVLDGTDAVMLSGETAIGRDPVSAVAMMSRLVARAEAEADYLQWGGRLAKVQEADGIPAAVSHAAWRAAIDAKVAAILCCTRSGATPRSMARFRPLAALVALSPDDRSLRQLMITWGVIALPSAERDSTDSMVADAIERARAAGLVADGQTVAVLAGASTAPAGVTDTLRLVRVAAAP